MPQIQTTTTFLVFLLLLPSLTSYSSCQQPPSQADADDLSSTASDYPYAPISSASWTNHPSLLQHTVNTSDGTQVRVVLLRNPSGLGPRFACGFICNGTCATFLFSVFALFVNSGSGIIYSASPHIVWTANRDNPVHENATLRLTSDGDLRLADADGFLVWSSNTSNEGIASIQLHKLGNLVLADASNGTIWQSWDHVTDTLLAGQILIANQSLVSGVSDTNSSGGSYFFGIRDEGLGLYASAPGLPQSYWIAASANGTYAIFNSTSRVLDLYNSSDMVVDSSISLAEPNAFNISSQFVRVDPDGILRLYSASDSMSSWAVLDIAPDTSNPCQIPSYCGPYGLCTDGQCSCYYGNVSSSIDSFTQIDPQRPNLGCIASTPLQCDAPSNHSFLQLSNVDYFTFVTENLDQVNSLDDCKQRCLANCSCKAAFFRNGLGSNVTSPGSCYIATEVYTMRKSSDQDLQNNVHYQPTALIKVQLSPISPAEAQRQGKSLGKSAIIGISVGAGFIVLVSLSLLILCVYRRMKEEEEEDDADPFLKSVPGLPSRYTYQQLKDATQNFSRKLGEGGFGSVFLGTMQDGTQVAVKRLEGSGQGQKEFRNEVCTIGSIHHLNLVRLCGFCAEKSHRLLVYEFMPNGSLDRWLFIRSKETSPAAADEEEMRNVLDWPTRFKIALGTAQGLAYLHEECRERIMHFDVKPQNILLDEHFEAKVSDFGLSKFVDRNQSQVLTTMRGTPGYLAPEWLHSTVTEKVDVYSYGIVLLEIVSGRKCLEMRTNDGSESGYSYLPSLASLKVEQGKLLDIVDERLVVGGGVVDMEEPERAILVALWCIQGDPSLRPSMSSVVQMLEGIVPVEFPPKLSGLAGIRPPPITGLASLELSSSLSDEPWSMPPEGSFFTSAR